MIALACSKPPKGRARWTLRLLGNKVVELGIVDRASDSTIGRTRKKTLQPHRRHPAEGQQRVRSCRRGLRSRLERLGRHPLRARQDHRSGPGQSQHPQQGFTLRSLSGRRSQAPDRALRVALHSKTRQLAQSGRPGEERRTGSFRICARSPQAQ